MTGKWIVVLLAVIAPARARAADVRIEVDANRVIAERPHSLIGGNIEDLNWQLYGGLYSQLLHGESFEENIGVDWLALPEHQAIQIWVGADENGGPLLRHFTGRNWWDARDPRGRDRGKVTLGPITFTDGLARPQDLPPAIADELRRRFTGDEQISRHWAKVQSGTASGTFHLARGQSSQVQVIEFQSGDGELGLDNAGLFRRGIRLEAGKPYQGMLRLDGDGAQELFVSLRDETGRVLDERPMKIAAPGTAEFELTPSQSTPRARFAVVLKRPGTVKLDYAFLQPGDWGRFHGLPVKKEFAEALLSMGVKTLRYNGSMVNRCPDPYRWKDMIAPRDQRRPYHGWFNPYASHGFSIFEFLDFCEAAAIYPVVGLSDEETPADMADFIDYCLAGPESPWGRRRIESGHPKPYALKAVEIGNEARADLDYVNRFKTLAAAIWAKNPDTLALASVNVRAGTKGLVDLAAWVRSQRREKQFVLDSHYRADQPGVESAVGAAVHDAVERDLPGFDLKLWPLEENGDECNWRRGLAHARALIALNRMPAYLERAGTANTFQAWGLALMWDQGRIHFTPDQIFFQPSYYVDRMFADEWLPVVVESRSERKGIDAVAKKNADGSVLAVYLANADTEPVKARLEVKGFEFNAAAARQIASSDPEALNTPQNPQTIAARNVPCDMNGVELPARSFTVVRLSKG